jgi:hypothetical protein
MATDFIAFTEGETDLLTSGAPSGANACSFALSTKPCSGAGAHTAADTFGGGFGEITGTGYARQTQTRPTPSAGQIAFAQMTWSTSSATDWPSSVKSVVLIDATNSKLLCAWNLVAGGTARDLSQASTTEQVTPTLTTTS